MPRQPRVTSGTEIYHVMMRGINHQEIFCDAEDYYQFINILDRMRTQYDDEGNSRRRPSDDQIWNLIKEKTGVTNNSAFQQLDNDTKQQVFLELKDCGASLRQLERLEQRVQSHACMSFAESRQGST